MQWSSLNKATIDKLASDSAFYNVGDYGFDYGQPVSQPAASQPAAHPSSLAASPATAAIASRPAAKPAETSAPSTVPLVTPANEISVFHESQLDLDLLEEDYILDRDIIDVMGANNINSGLATPTAQPGPTPVSTSPPVSSPSQTAPSTAASPIYASPIPAVVFKPPPDINSPPPSPPLPTVPSPPTQTAVTSPSPAFLKSAASTTNMPSISGSDVSQYGQGSHVAEERHQLPRAGGGNGRQQGGRAIGDQEKESEMTWKAAAGSGAAAVDVQQPGIEAPPHPALGAVIEVVRSAHEATGSIKPSDIR